MLRKSRTRPPMLGRRRWSLCWLAVPLLVLLIDMLARLSQRGVIPDWTFLAVLCTTALAVVSSGLIARGRLRGRVAATRGLVCWHCGYDLSASPPKGQCPECGSPYTWKELRRLWRQADWSL